VVHAMMKRAEERIKEASNEGRKEGRENKGSKQ
jgi:hypothetical protein